MSAPDANPHKASSPRISGPAVIAAGLEIMEDLNPTWTSILSEELTEYGLDIHRVSMPDLLDASPHASISTIPALIILSQNESDRTISKLMDTLSESMAAALVLVHPSQTKVQAFMHAEGILCESFDTTPRDASMMLRTLAQRQPALQRLNTDLRLSEMTINGVQSEVAKLHEELQTAANIQREYLPESSHDIDGVDVGVIYRPASYVSGDIYDITQLDENRSAFFLADAVGHGVPAALMTMVITQGLRKIDGSGIGSTIVQPAEALKRLNNTMSRNAGDNSRFATAMYAIYDKSTNEVTISGAGHPPALIVRAETGETELVDSQGPLLGVFSDVEFGQTTIALNPGDVLVFYSDGFEVAFPNQADNEHDRRRPTTTYLSRLSNAGNGSENLNKSVQILEDNLDNQMGSLHQPDDITAIFIAPSSQRSESTSALIDDLNANRFVDDSTH